MTHALGQSPLLEGQSPALAGQSPVLSVQGVVMRFGGLYALRGVDLMVHPNEIVGLIGPNGAGKTTLFNVISGFLRPSAGEVRFDGRAVQGWPPYRLARLGLVRTFQITRPFRRLSVEDNVMIGLGRSVYGRPWGLVSRYGRPEYRRTAHEILERLDLTAYARRPAGSLPIGLQRRLEIARALAVKPRVLLLDEPVAGLNPQEASEMASLIRRLHGDGLTLVVVEHNMAVAMSLCQRIAVLHNGAKIAEGPPELVSADPAVVEAYLGSRGKGRER